MFPFWRRVLSNSVVASAPGFSHVVGENLWQRLTACSLQFPISVIWCLPILSVILRAHLAGAGTSMINTNRPTISWVSGMSSKSSTLLSCENAWESFYVLTSIAF
jgi:hypothetical protein